MHQLELVCLDKVVSENHRYRGFLKVWDFKGVDRLLLTVRRNNPYEGYGLSILFRCLLLQFLEDLSDLLNTLGIIKINLNSINLEFFIVLLGHVLSFQSTVTHLGSSCPFYCSKIIIIFPLYSDIYCFVICFYRLWG